VAILLKKLDHDDETRLLDFWEKTSFRVFGLCRKDKRTAVGDYVRLGWDILNAGSEDVTSILNKIKTISEGTDHSIEWAKEHLADENCYDGWEEELRYLLYRYEEHLARKNGQKFSNEQWNRIWEASAARSIEHICPQSKGSQDRTPPSSKTVFVHRLGNLLLLPPDLNATLLAKDPEDKAEAYMQTGLLAAAEVANTIKKEGWNTKQVVRREKHLLDWVESVWA